MGTRGKGISKQKATVIVTTDRKNDLNMTFCGYGRLTKAEISESLHTPLPQGTVLYSDGHVSYKGYAMDNHLGACRYFYNVLLMCLCQSCIPCDTHPGSSAH